MLKLLPSRPAAMRDLPTNPACYHTLPQAEPICIDLLSDEDGGGSASPPYAGGANAAAAAVAAAADEGRGQSVRATRASEYVPTSERFRASALGHESAGHACKQRGRLPRCAAASPARLPRPAPAACACLAPLPPAHSLSAASHALSHLTHPPPPQDDAYGHAEANEAAPAARQPEQQQREQRQQRFTFTALQVQRRCMGCSAAQFRSRCTGSAHLLANTRALHHAHLPLGAGGVQ